MSALLKHLWSPVTPPGCPSPPCTQHPGVCTALTLERQLRVPASILQECQEEGPEHLRALVVGGEDVEQPPALLAAVPARKSQG